MLNMRAILRTRSERVELDRKSAIERWRWIPLNNGGGSVAQRGGKRGELAGDAGPSPEHEAPA